MENGNTYEVGNVYEKDFDGICKIRAVMIDGKEWYFAVDVADIFDVYACSVYRNVETRKTIYVGYRKNIVIDLDSLIAYCKRKAFVNSKAEKLLKVLESPKMEAKPEEEQPVKENNTGLVLFHNEEFSQLRMMEIDGEPWFVGKDVAEALGYTDTFGALKKHVDDDDKRNCQNDSFNNNRGMVLINESGMYSLILSSKLATAKKFKHWVTSEVLPSIRNNGSYGVDPRVEQLIQNQSEFIKATQALTEQMILISDRLTAVETANTSGTGAAANPQNATPKKTYKEIMDERTYPVNITTIARDFGHEPAELNFVLCKAGIQYKYGKTYYPTDLYVDHGIMKELQYKDKASGEIMVYTRWTREGNDLIREKVTKDLGWIPLCELTA